MAKLVISKDSGAADLAPIALAINAAVGLPVTLRSSRVRGVRVEKGKMIDDSYSGPILEEVLIKGAPVRTVPQEGAYKGIPVSVAPIMVEGEVVAALGVVDVIGTIDLSEVFGAYPEVVKQVTER
jgi:hypothetical protein